MSKNTVERYGSINPDVLRSPELTISDKAVYIALTYFISAGGASFPSLATLKLLLGLSQSTLSKCTHRLQDAGVINIIQRYDMSNLYTMCQSGSIAVKYKDFSNQTLDKNAKVIFAAMTYLRRASVADIVNFLHVSRPTVVKGLKTLMQSGFLCSSEQEYDKQYWIAKQDPIKEVPQYRGYTKVPKILFGDYRLTAMSKALYVALLSLGRSNCDDMVISSHSELMKTLRCGYKRLKDALKQLVRCGYLNYQPCYKGFIYTFKKNNTSHIKLFKDIILDPRTNFKDIDYYIRHHKSKYLAESYRYRKMRNMKYIRRGVFVDLKKYYTHLEGHRLNVAKHIGMFKALYVDSSHLPMVKKICSAITFDYNRHGELYKYYCKDSDVDVDHICLRCISAVKRGKSVTQALYRMIHDGTIPHKLEFKKNHHIKKEELFKHKIATRKYAPEDGAIVQINMVFADNKTCWCTNLSTNRKEEIYSSKYRLQVGKKYYIQKQTRFEPKLRKNRTILICAEKF